MSYKTISPFPLIIPGAGLSGLGSFIAIQWGKVGIITVIVIAGGLGIANGLIFA